MKLWILIRLDGILYLKSIYGEDQILLLAGRFFILESGFGFNAKHAGFTTIKEAIKFVETELQ